MIKKLKSVRGLYFFHKEAKAIRGISDIIGCTPSGRFFAWELKRSKWEIYYKSKPGLKLYGRTKQQWHELSKVRASGGIGEFVYPENFKEKLKELLCE